MASREPRQLPEVITPETLSKIQRHEQLSAVNTYLLTLAIGMGIGYLVLAVISGSILAPPLFIVPLYLVLWRINTVERLNLVSAIAGILGTPPLLIGLHLINGSATAFVVLLPLTLITFLVLYEGRSFVIASIALLLSYGLIVAVEASGIMPPLQIVTSAQLSAITPILTILAITISTIILYFTIARYRNAEERAIDQARSLTQLNRDLVLGRQLQQHTAIEVTSAAQRLNTVIELQVRGVDKQAGVLLNVSASAEQLDHEAQSIAARANTVSTLAGAASGEAASSTKLINDAVAAAEQAYANVANVAALTSTLSDRIQQIDSVISLLNRIAHETHILSLNAAIEAAAAEEIAAGRRFTIIADEVRSLAAEARASAEQVQNLTMQISQAAQLTTQATRESMMDAERSLALLQQATASVHLLSTRVAESEGEARSILTSTAEQQNISHEVADSLRQVSNVAQQIAGGGQQMQTVSELLNGLVVNLQNG